MFAIAKPWIPFHLLLVSSTHQLRIFRCLVERLTSCRYLPYASLGWTCHSQRVQRGKLSTRFSFCLLSTATLVAMGTVLADVPRGTLSILPMALTSCCHLPCGSIGVPPCMLRAYTLQHIPQLHLTRYEIIPTSLTLVACIRNHIYQT